MDLAAFKTKSIFGFGNPSLFISNGVGTANKKTSAFEGFVWATK